MVAAPAALKDLRISTSSVYLPPASVFPFATLSLKCAEKWDRTRARGLKRGIVFQIGSACQR